MKTCLLPLLLLTAVAFAQEKPAPAAPAAPLRLRLRHRATFLIRKRSMCCAPRKVKS
jgi:hypothetical protein